MQWFWFRAENGNWLVALEFPEEVQVTTFYFYLAGARNKNLKIPIRHFDIYPDTRERYHERQGTL